MKPFNLLILAVLLSACASVPTEDRNYKVVKIISEPSGAKIEVNGSYIGQAPTAAKVRCWPDDQVVKDKLTVTALPFAEGQYIQKKEFMGPTHPFDEHHDVVPDTILFQMNLKPEVPQKAP